MPEPRGPHHGQETLTLGGTKPGSALDEENQKVGQDQPRDKDRYANSQRQDEGQKAPEDVNSIEDLEEIEEVEGTENAEDLEHAGGDSAASDSLTDQEKAQKQAGRMLDPKNLSEGDE
jgi:hypothetical protein